MLLKIANSLYKAISLLLGAAFIALVSILLIIFYYGRELPDYKQLSNYTPPIITRFYTADGKLLEEYALESRIFTNIDKMPKLLIAAFLAAEDKNYYTHSGLDIRSIGRALFKNVINLGSNKSLVGGSTITQQVVKNFLLTNERSFARKIKEAILSFRISKAYSKDKILELYLNQIYLGNRSYGVTYAALSYFNKSLEQLNLQEIAFLASLPKAPTNYDPKKFYNKALGRRNWVIDRMKEESFINENDASIASKQPIELKIRHNTDSIKADFFSESVRREIVEIYGDKNLYEAGFNVYTTLDSELQIIAEKAFKNGLIRYDKKYGYRGPLNNVTNLDNWKASLKDLEDYKNITYPWSFALVKEVKNDKAFIELENENTGSININDTAWAKSNLKSLKEIFKIGDIIIVENNSNNSYSLQQLPKVNGGLVVLEPNSGKILAMVGGLFNNAFNRTTQAKRQPGSAFKPFVYLAALENGFTPESIILDGPIELYQGPNLPLWRPKNYSRDYLGPTTLRKGLEKSRNTMTVRLGQAVGINKLIEVTKRFGINENPPRNFSIVLGATETSLLSLTNAYSIIVNGGKKVSPTQIEYIQDSNGTILYRNNYKQCFNCKIDDDMDIFSFIPPELEDNRKQILDPAISYQMISMLIGVVQQGTASAARKLGDNIGGKTGTTNNSKDLWFIGFSKNLVMGAYVGHDSPKNLGKRETGASTALPIFVDFMDKALKIRPNIGNFQPPEGVNMIEVDPLIRELKEEPDKNATNEILKKDTNPVIENSSSFSYEEDLDSIID